MSLKLHYSKLCGLSCVEPCSTTEKSVAWQRKKLNTRHKCVFFHSSWSRSTTFSKNSERKQRHQQSLTDKQSWERVSLTEMHWTDTAAGAETDLMKWIRYLPDVTSRCHYKFKGALWIFLVCPWSLRNVFNLFPFSEDTSTVYQYSKLCIVYTSVYQLVLLVWLAVCKPA